MGGRQANRERLACRVVDGLLRAGPTVTRAALRDDNTLAALLSPDQLARLADYARPKAVPAKRASLANQNPLVTMNSWQRRPATIAGFRLLGNLITTVVFVVTILAVTYGVYAYVQ
ncbi:MAG: hypothetical protein HQL37_09215 [Alphaproteobacteria bacterium]|nr:hypothetical protein [Alphaproteobacteria bacterium]